MKKAQPSIKLVIAVGGWTAGSGVFNNILTNSTTRSMFIEQAKQFLTKWNFDGIDLVEDRALFPIHSKELTSVSLLRIGSIQVIMIEERRIIHETNLISYLKYTYEKKQTK